MQQNLDTSKEGSNVCWGQLGRGGKGRGGGLGCSSVGPARSLCAYFLPRGGARGQSCHHVVLKENTVWTQCLGSAHLPPPTHARDPSLPGSRDRPIFPNNDWTLLRVLLCPSHYKRYLIPSSPQLWAVGILIVTIYGWGNGGSERLGNSLQALQLASAGARLWAEDWSQLSQSTLVASTHTASLSSLLLPSRQVVPHVSGRSCGLLVCISEHVRWVFKFRHGQHHHLWGLRGASAEPPLHWHT